MSANDICKGNVPHPLDFHKYLFQILHALSRISINPPLLSISSICLFPEDLSYHTNPQKPKITCCRITESVENYVKKIPLFSMLSPEAANEVMRCMQYRTDHHSNTAQGLLSAGTSLHAHIIQQVYS